MKTKKSGRKLTEDKLHDFDEWFGSLHETPAKKPSTVQFISKALDVVEGTDEDRSNGSRTKKRKPSAPNHVGTVDKLLSGQSIMPAATKERAVQARTRRAVKVDGLKSSTEHSRARRRCTRESVDRILQDFPSDMAEEIICPIKDPADSRHSRSMAKDSSMDASGNGRRRSDRLASSQHASSHSRHRTRDSLSSSQHGRRPSEIPEVSPSIDRAKRVVGRDELGSSSHHGNLPRRRQGSSNHDRMDQTSNGTPNDDGFGEVISHNKHHFGTERSSPQTSPTTKSSPTERKRRDGMPFVSPHGSDTELLAKLKITQSPYDKDKVIVEMDKETLLTILCGRQGVPTLPAEKREVRSPGSKKAARLPLPPLCRQSNHGPVDRKAQTIAKKRSVEIPF